jgi:hypothetical protein
MGRLCDRVWRRVVELILLAGDTEDDGRLPPVEDIAWRLRCDLDQLRQDMSDLAAAGIVGKAADGSWFVVNFTKRQGAESSTERSRRFRKQRRIDQFSEAETDQETPPEHTRDSTETDTQRECNEGATKRPADVDIDVEVDVEVDVEEMGTENNDATASPATKPADGPAKRSRKAKKPVPIAVQVFRENAHRFPPKAWYENIAEEVGDDQAELEVWGRIVKAWVGKGWNPGNVSGMLQFYQRGEVPGPVKGKGSTLERNMENIADWVHKEGAS